MAIWKGIIGKPFTPEAFASYVRTLRFEAWKPSFVVLHNTAAPTLAEWQKVSGETRMKNLESYYKSLGWSAGPHLFVADDLIWLFTPLTTPGVHSPSWNAVSWGVEMVGDYDQEAFDTGPGASVRDNAVQALAILHSRLDIDSHTLRLHKEDPKTTHACPGINVDRSDIIRRVHEAIISLGKR